MRGHGGRDNVDQRVSEKDCDEHRLLVRKNFKNLGRFSIAFVFEFLHTDRGKREERGLACGEKSGQAKQTNENQNGKGVIHC